MHSAITNAFKQHYMIPRLKVTRSQVFCAFLGLCALWASTTYFSKAYSHLGFSLFLFGMLSLFVVLPAWVVIADRRSRIQRTQKALAHFAAGFLPLTTHWGTEDRWTKLGTAYILWVQFPGSVTREELALPKTLRDDLVSAFARTAVNKR